MELQDILKHLRSKKALSQRELAKMLNLSPSTIAMYETGQRSPDTDTIKVFAEFYGVTTDYLLGRSNVPNPQTGLSTFPSSEPTPQELEEILRTSNVQFDGAPLDETDKEEVLEFLRYAWNKLRAKK